MATSGTRIFDPDLAQYTDEAYSRCGIRRLAITSEHIEDALLSANFMLTDWSNRGFKQFELTDATLAMVTAQEAYSLPVGTLDIWTAVLRRSSVDDPMYAISRQDYQDIPRKDHTGRPDRYFVDRSQLGNGQRQVYIWPSPENNTDVVRYVGLRRPEDVAAMVETAPIAYEWQEAFVSGLASRLALKYAPERFPVLQGLAQGDSELRGGAFMRALDADRERAPAVFRMTRGHRGRG